MNTSLILSKTDSASSRRDQIFPYLVVAVVHLVSSIPGLNSLYLVFSLVGFIYWTLKKKDELALLLLLLGSSFSYTSLSIWNNGVVPGLPFLLLGLSLMVVGVRVTTGRLITTTFCVLGLFTLSLANVFVVGIHPVIVDLLVVLSIPLAAIRFRKLSEQQFFLTFSACALIAVLKIIIFAFVGVQNPVLSTYTQSSFLDTHDELTGFYILFILVLMCGPNRLRWLSTGLFCALIFHYISSDNWLGYYGIGSQVLLALIVFILSLLVRFPIGLFVIACVVLFITSMANVFSDITDDLKLQQLVSMLEILSKYNFDLLPHSLQVRVAEISTFFEVPWLHQIFGRGLGGYINLSDHFPIYLGPDDFSQQQIDSGKITTPHNLGYLMIKFGYAGLALALAFLVWIYRVALRMVSFKFALYITFGVFLILNLGYTLKNSFLLGVLWVVISECYRNKRAEIQSSDIDLNASRRIY